MILVLSQQDNEPTTEAVMEWIGRLGGECVRLNGADLTGGGLAMEWETSGHGASLSLDGRSIALGEVRVVWLRRWDAGPGMGGTELPPEVAARVQGHLVREIRAATSALHAALAHAEWLTHPDEIGLSKFRALRLAAAAGLDIPATLVTTDAARAREFAARHGRVITKPLSDADHVVHDGVTWGMYTAEVTAQELEGAPDTLFPSLLQERLEKTLEVRAFWLDGRCWAMAIFSQADGQTTQDFRRYNPARPNRTVPYRLPPEVERGVGAFMEAAGLSTGSLDFVRTPDGRHVFLEVNPAGQFGMVSHPCNYSLEKRVAEYLVWRDCRERAA